MKLLIVYILFSVITLILKSKKTIEDSQDSPLYFIFNRKILTLIVTYSVSIAFLVTDTAFGLLITAMAFICYYITTGMSYSEYSTKRFNLMLTGCILLFAGLLILSQRYVLLNTSSLILVMMFYIFVLYDKYIWHKTNKKKILYTVSGILLSMLLLYSVVHYAPSFIEPPQKRIASRFLNAEYGNVPEFIYYDKKLRGEPIEINAFFTSGDSQDHFKVKMTYLNGKIVNHERIDL